MSQTKRANGHSPRMQGEISRRGALSKLGTAALGVLLANCRESSGPEENYNSNFSLPVNGSDPLLLRTTASGGEVIDYLGRRDANGFALGLDYVVITSTNGSETRFRLRADGRPIRMTDNGTAVDLNWLSPTSAVATIRSRDDTSQLSTLVDITSAPSAQFALHALDGRQSLPRSSVDANFEAILLPATPSPPVPQVNAFGSIVNVRVTECGRGDLSAVRCLSRRSRSA